MKTIHVIHKIDSSNQPKKVAGKLDTFTSGNWVINLPRAESLEDNKIYLHRSRSSPSFMGGKIARATEFEPHNGRIRVVFEFTAEKGSIGVMASADGWRNEYKITE
ncbi:MAG: hypothetical protein EAZ09_02590 [Oscillatoriales cyanobacterium]|jgi:hypothetical protein|nr:MAG: hypothetical protein EAZ18_23340 [Oscillatoriales cyanobacterium]TAH25146.1 MAG: hypothetical protein EAZ09_02590 [Oscillatoriales cyanobacterium]